MLSSKSAALVSKLKTWQIDSWVFGLSCDSTNTPFTTNLELLSLPPNHSTPSPFSFPHFPRRTTPVSFSLCRLSPPLPVRVLLRSILQSSQLREREGRMWRVSLDAAPFSCSRGGMRDGVRVLCTGGLLLCLVITAAAIPAVIHRPVDSWTCLDRYGKASLFADHLSLLFRTIYTHNIRLKVKRRSSYSGTYCSYYREALIIQWNSRSQQENTAQSKFNPNACELITKPLCDFALQCVL